VCLREVMELRDSSDQDMSNGCLTWCSKQGLGLGVSNAAAKQPRGVRYEGPQPFMREYLARMRAVSYMAAATPVDPPIVLGSLLPRMIELAATGTAGVLTYFTPPDKTAQVRAVIRPGKWPCAEQALLLEADPARARAAAREYMKLFLGAAPHPKMLTALGFQDADFAGGGSDRLVDAIVVCGSVDALRERIAAHHAAGASHVCILPLRPDGDRAPDERVLEALAPR
jgi:probable F420-dependent oxidoreductase